MPLESIRESWESYLDMAFPDGLPAASVRECRRAFYAGFHAMLCTMEVMGTPGISEEAAVLHCQALAGECRRFVRDMSEGRA